MSSVRQHPIHLFLIIVIVCVLAPASEGMSYAVLCSIFIYLNCASRSVKVFFLVMFMKQDEDFKIRQLSHR